ncbi:MAG: methionyl-tRNA formyltransferase [Candidatus Omnitrophota bacterium]
MRIVFFGSDDFALTNLEALISSGEALVACVTPPDKPKGRGLKVLPSVVKQCALKNKIPVLQPDNLQDDIFLHKLKSFSGDLSVVIAYGKILPAEVLSVPKIFSINVHGSFLPQYRGAAPINRAIINGDKKTGISVIKMNQVMDGGEIILQEEMLISDEDNSLTLRARMAQEGARLLMRAMDSIRDRSYTLTPQDPTKVSYAPKLTKELGLIQWRDSAVSINNLIRGLLPWPCAYTHFQGKALRILEAEVVRDGPGGGKSGEVLSLKKNGFVVAAAEKALLVKKVHLESAKQMGAAAFALGHKLSVGYRLG